MLNNYWNQVQSLIPIFFKKEKTPPYENLNMVLEAVKDGKLNTDIEQAERIVRSYNSENDT